MQVLESKQQLLDDTKKTYVGTENKVKQLKDEAMSARKELDDLKRRENTIEKECNTIEILKKNQVQQKELLSKSILQAEADFDKEITALKLELESIQKEIEAINSTDITNTVKENVEKQARERELLLKDFQTVQNEIQLNNQKFIAHVQEQLQELLLEFTKKEQENPLETEISNCKEDVNSLVAKIKSNTTVPL
jgi:chromosome segregation ATPase